VFDLEKASEMILARQSQLKFYRDIKLYGHVKEKGFVLYKPSGVTLDDLRISEERYPGALYIKQADKIRGIQEAQRGFNQQLKNHVIKGDSVKIKEILVNIIEETLTEPRSGSLEGMSETVNILAGDYAKKSEVVANLLAVSSKDYSTVLHSINLLAFALGFANHANYSLNETRVVGLCALLHDVGKVKISQEILAAPRKLTKEEFEKMQQHPLIGYNILKNCNFNSIEIIRTALDHHEKLDRSGYPHGKDNISKIAQILGIIDCYEALTNDNRPYRKAATPFEALGLLKKDVQEGKFDDTIFAEFVHYLGEK